MPIFNTRNPLEYLLGAGELGLSGATNLASMIGSVPYGVYKQLESGEYGQNTDAFDKYSKQLMDAGTYQPRTAAAQEMGSLIGSLVEDAKIPPVMPELMPIAALSANPAARNAQIERAGMAAEKAIEPAVLRTLEKGGTNAQMLQDMVRGSMSPMDVYHGSPYKFDAFKSSQIGSGEGAQAYGYGHYLAESPDVAKFYQPRDMDYENQLMKLYKNAEKSQDYDSLTVLEDALTHSTPSELLATHGEKFKPLIEKIKSIEQKSGLYKVDLPDDQIAKMLDWDKPLKDQTPEVQALAKQYNLTDADHLGGDLVAAMDAKRRAGAQMMREAGIPGIRYFDEGSRGFGRGTSNFVVFPGNEGLLSILERNEQNIR